MLIRFLINFNYSEFSSDELLKVNPTLPKRYLIELLSEKLKTLKSVRNFFVKITENTFELD